MSQTPRLTRTGARPPRPGIVHLGPGAFFRAFNTVYTHDAMAACGGDWGIIAVSLRSPDARDQLVPQGCVYTSVTLGESGRSARVIGSVAQVLVAPEDPETVIAAMADPAVKIVSLTVTEKGYCHDPATGRLLQDHPDIRHDLDHPAEPRSMPGLVVAALSRRRADGTGPFTVLSCDNLPSNGRLAGGVIKAFAAARDAALADWIAAQVPFPSTMVDRITPATTDADVARLADDEGYHDPACVTHEAFRQWVIEDNFTAGRPAWEEAGAQVVANVDRHETMKLRCLNGTHSTLAYLGYLAGYETIADTVADPDFAGLCRKLWSEEIVPTVPRPEGEDLEQYCDALMGRYTDRSIRHRTWQIAMDGSQKLPQRILGTIRDNLAAGRRPRGLCLAVAGWMRYVGGIDDAGDTIDVRDPMAEQLRAACDAAATPSGKVNALLAFRDVFGEALPADDRFRDDVTTSFEALERDGAARTVRAFLA